MARDHASCEQPGGGFSRFGTYAGQCSPSRSVGLAKMVHARSSKLSIEMGDSDKMRSPAWSRLRAKKPRPAAEEVSTSSASFATDENEADPGWCLPRKGVVHKGGLLARIQAPEQTRTRTVGEDTHVSRTERIA